MLCYYLEMRYQYRKSSDFSRRRAGLRQTDLHTRAGASLVDIIIIRAISLAVFVCVFLTGPSFVLTLVLQHLDRNTPEHLPNRRPSLTILVLASRAAHKAYGLPVPEAHEIEAESARKPQLDARRAER